MTEPVATVRPAQRAILIIDLLLAVVALCFTVPRSFTPAQPDHYWSADILFSARYVSLLFAAMAVAAVACWFNQIARVVLVGVIALVVLKALNDFRLEMQLAASTDVPLSLLVQSGGFWLDVISGLLPSAWLCLHWWLFMGQRGGKQSGVQGVAL